MLHSKRSADLGQEALAFLASQELPSLPQNYKIAYAYVSKNEPAIVALLDAALAAHGRIASFTLQEASSLFKEEEERNNYINIVDDSHLHLTAAVQTLQAAGGDARSYGAVLLQGTQSLTTTTDAQTQQELLQRLISATNAMISKTQKLEAQLALSSREMASLRGDLDHARMEARTDALTGLPNRKAFNQFIEKHFAECLLSKQPLSVMFCDIDHFKSFNDTWGHRMGDEVLRLVGHSLEKLCAGQAFASRYGGEEFIVVLPQKNVETAVLLADQIRTFIGSRTVRAKSLNKTVGQITISLGVSQLKDNDDIETLIERADMALYHAKQTGRNRVCTEHDLKNSAAA